MILHCVVDFKILPYILADFYRLLKFGNWQRWEKDVETEKKQI